MAENYAKNSLRYRKIDSGLANTYFELCQSELRNCEKLHEQVKIILDSNRTEAEGIPISLQVVYDFLFDVYIEKYSKVKTLISQYD